MLVSTKPQKKLLNSRIARFLRQFKVKNTALALPKPDGFIKNLTLRIYRLGRWKYPLLSSYFFFISLYLPNPAQAYVFQGYVDFGATIFDAALGAIGLSALQPFTKTISQIIAGIILLFIGGWIISHCYEAVQSYRQKEYQGMWEALGVIVFAIIIVFLADFGLKQIFAGAPGTPGGP